MASCQSCPSKESDYLDAYTANALLSSNSPVQAHCSSGSTLFCFADPTLQSSLFCGCSIDHSNYANMQRVKYSSSLYAEEDASCVWQSVNASPGHDPGSVAGTWEMCSTHFEYQLPDPGASEELLCLPSTQMHDLCSEVLRNDGGRQFRGLTHSNLFPSSDVDMASCSNDSATIECASGPPEAKMMVTVCSNLVVPKVSSSIGARDDLLIDMEKTAGFNYPSTSQSSYEFGPPVHNFGSAELRRVVHSQSECSTNFSFDPFFVQVEKSVSHHTIGIENSSAPVLNHERSAIQTVDDHSNVVKCLSRTFSCPPGLRAPVHDSWATPISTDRHSALQITDDGQKRPHVALSVLPSASSNVAESKLCRSISYPLQSRYPNELHQACSSPQQLESLERENRELSSSSDIGKNFRTCDDRIKSRKTALTKIESATVLLPITDGKEMIIGCADKRPKRCKIEDMILEECVTSLNEEKRCRGSSKPATTSRKRTRDHAKLGLEIPKDVIHVRARRGQATDSHSLAERVRREKISQRMRVLQELVPGCHKVHGKAVMLDVIINYVQSLQQQVEFLSMRLAAASPTIDGCVATKQKTMEISQCELASLFDLLLNSFSSIQP